MRLVDAIAYRKDLEEELNFHRECDNREIVQGLEIAIADLGDMPTIEAKPVVYGRWLYDSYTEKYFCSACNEEAIYSSRDVPEYDYDWEENLRYSHTESIFEEHLTKFCPNCGAIMDLESEGTDE